MEKTYKITKLVVCIILMCVSLGTAIFFAIIPFVKVNTAYNFKAPDAIELFVDGNVKKHIAKTDSEYSEIMELYNDSFIVSKSDLVFGNETIGEQKFQSSKSFNKKGTYMVFVYNSEQTLKHGQTTAKYITVTFELANTENMTLTNAYVVDNTNTSTTTGITFKYSTYAKQHKLYSYVQDLI